MTERLYYHDAYAHEFDATVVGVDASVGAPGPLRSRPRPHGLLSDLRRPAVRYRHARRRSRRRRHRWRRRPDPARGGRSNRARPDAGRHRLAAPLRAYAAAHRSTRAFSGLRPVAQRAERSASISARPPRPSIWRARSRRRRLREPSTRPIALSGRTGRSRFDLRTRMRSRRCRCERNRNGKACCGWLTSRTSTCRRVAGRTSRARVQSASSRSPRSRSSRVGPGSSFCAVGAPSPAITRSATAVAASVRLLSVLPAELPAAIDRGQTDARDLRRQVKDLQTRLAGHEADALAERAEPVGAAARGPRRARGRRGMPTVSSPLRPRLRRGLGTLQSSSAFPTPSAIVVARAPDVEVDSAAILKQLTATFGGKGGGRPELAQGGGLKGDANAMLGAARTVISE